MEQLKTHLYVLKAPFSPSIQDIKSIWFVEYLWSGEHGLHVPISVWDLLNLKGHYSSPILQLFKEKPETVEFETHTHKMLCHFCSRILSLNH